MGSKMNRQAYERLVAEDIEWLQQQPRTLERDHIEAILKGSVSYYYPEPPSRQPTRLDLCPACQHELHGRYACEECKNAGKECSAFYGETNVSSAPNNGGAVSSGMLRYQNMKAEVSLITVSGGAPPGCVSPFTHPEQVVSTTTTPTAEDALKDLLEHIRDKEYFPVSTEFRWKVRRGWDALKSTQKEPNE